MAQNTPAIVTLAVYKIGSYASALWAYVRRLRCGGRHGPSLIRYRFRPLLAALNNEDTCFLHTSMSSFFDPGHCLALPNQINSDGLPFSPSANETPEVVLS